MDKDADFKRTQPDWSKQRQPQESDMGKKRSSDAKQKNPGSGPAGTPTEHHPIRPRYEDPDIPRNTSKNPMRGPDIKPDVRERDLDPSLDIDPRSTPDDPNTSRDDNRNKDGTRR